MDNSSSSSNSGGSSSNSGGSSSSSSSGREVYERSRVKSPRSRLPSFCWHGAVQPLLEIQSYPRVGLVTLHPTRVPLLQQRSTLDMYLCAGVHMENIIIILDERIEKFRQG